LTNYVGKFVIDSGMFRECTVTDIHVATGREMQKPWFIGNQKCSTYTLILYKSTQKCLSLLSSN